MRFLSSIRVHFLLAFALVPLTVAAAARVHAEVITISETAEVVAAIEKPASLQTATKNRSGLAFSSLEELNLSLEQEEEIDGIRAGMMDDLSEILTEEQFDEMLAAQESEADMMGVMRGLGLTSSQRSDLIDTMRSTQDQIMSVLTPEQRALLEEESPRDRKSLQ